MTRKRPFRPRRWALLLLLLAAGVVLYDLFLPAGPFPRREERSLLVRRGQSLHEVATEMKRLGLLRGTTSFLVLARATGVDRHVKAGQYSFRLGTTVPQLLHAFARGMSGLSLVTIPEGLTIQETALLLANHLGIAWATFDSLARDTAFVRALGVSGSTLEGYLFPDTYEFLPGTEPEVALRDMVGRSREVLTQETTGLDSLPLDMSLAQVLTLASIVEAETGTQVERPRIAAVYLNRLRRGQRLQADPTVGYGIGLRPRVRLSLRDLQRRSPYNTYLYAGLPPGPICSPGRASIRAVLNPTPGSRELYFVARGDGRHIFSESYRQHLEAIRRARSAADSTRADTLEGGPGQGTAGGTTS